MGLVERLVSEEDKQLLKYANWVDNIDRILGPITSTCQLYGTPTIVAISTILSYAEVLLLKTPFIYKYVKRTGDYDALVTWIPKEIFANTVPYGNLIDIMKSYRNRTRRFFESKIETNMDKVKTRNHPAGQTPIQNYCNIRKEYSLDT